jgi:GntR family transcriptional regulator
MSGLATPLGPTSIDKSSPVPIYVQLKDILRAAIEDERIASNERIPSENDLSTEFNISRMTVRQAIRELVREGLVYARRGEGTFVSTANHTQMLVKLDGFSTQMAKEGHAVRSQVLRVELVHSADGHAEAFTGLGESPEGALVMMERVRFLDNEPFALERSYLNQHNGAHLLAREFDETFSIYRFLASERGTVLFRAEHSLEPKLADTGTAATLQIEPGSPVLFVRGTTYSVTGGAVEYLEGIYRGDRYTFRVVIAK